MAASGEHMQEDLSVLKKPKRKNNSTISDLLFNSHVNPENGYATWEHKYILWFFRFLAGFVLLIIVLLFTVHINDTVSFTEGEIISSNPQIDYKAPYESLLQKAPVKEGQKINPGDTLMVIYNEQVNSEYAKQKATKEYLEQKISSVQLLIAAVRKKKQSVGAENSINYSKYKLDIQNAYNNIEALDQQYKLQQQKLSSALEKTQADSILYHKDLVSKMEYNEGKNAANDVMESINTTTNEIQKQKAEKELNKNNFLKEQHNLKLKKIELEEDEQNLTQLQIDLEDQLEKATENFKLLEQELKKQYLIAATKGVVNYIYNAKQSSNIIEKGALLISISPDNNNKFYAKAIIPQKDIQYIGATMPAHIKLDAYYHLEYGIIKGKVTYVSERKENEKFYTLIQLDNPSQFRLKSGYNISGEIITERLILFNYFLKKIFKEFEKKQP
ncbi:MAG TPA: HlyD family efflux transporter periplasmic adaptor subunit, partial [Chitinophagaceae bacterium]